MADEQKTPVAIRITRPYATEQEYLEREFDTLTRTSVTLLGAQPRPQGVVLRFEIVLANGDSLIRGEGRVVGFKERAYAGESGLTLRFTRLDARSKTLLDQAATLREARVRASASVMGMPAVVPKIVDSAPNPSASFLDPARPPPPPVRRPPPPLPPHARSQVPPPPPSSSVEIEIESTQVDSTFHDPRPIPFAEPSSERLDEPLAAVPPPLPPPPAPPQVEEPQLPVPPPRAPSGFPPSRPRVSTRPPPLPPMPPRSGSSKPPPVPPTPPRASVPPPAAAPSVAPPAPVVPSFAAPTQARAFVPTGAPFAPATVQSFVERPTAEPRKSGNGHAIAPPAEREALLHRLRARARSLPQSRVTEILSKRAARE